MPSTTLSIKVDENFAKAFRTFCDQNCLQIGKFAQHTLTEIMEDYYFGMKAQKTLSAHSGKLVEHKNAFL